MRKVVLLFVMVFIFSKCDFFYPTRRLDAEPSKHYLSSEYFLNLDLKSFNKVITELASKPYIRNIDIASYTKKIVYLHSSNKYYKFNLEDGTMDSISRKDISHLKSIEEFRDNSKEFFKD